MKRSICWVTGSNFFNVDDSVVSMLKTEFSIKWYILIQKDKNVNILWIKNRLKELNVSAELVYLNRFRSVKNIFLYFNMIQQIKKINPDLLYLDALGLPYLFPMLLFSQIESDKLIYACHDFVEHVNIPHRRLIKFYKKIIFHRAKHFKFFSLSQQRLFQKVFPEKHSFYTYLTSQSYGAASNVIKSKDKVVFLFFGAIRENKGLEILIEAVNMLPQSLKGQYVVRICGYTSKWDYYMERINDVDNFELNIKYVQNKDVANVFQSSDYLVLPYRDVSQSGPLSISYNYNVPVIASDHDGFREFINNGINGFLFKNADANSLKGVLQKIIEGKVDYGAIKFSQQKFVEDNLNTGVIAEKYAQAFKNIIKQNDKKYNFYCKE